MKTLKIAATGFGAGAILLSLLAAPGARAFAASAVTLPPTHVSSSAPIAVGPSRSECLTPDFDDTGLAALQAAVVSFQTLTNSTVSCVSTYLDGALNWGQWDDPWITQSQYGYTSWVAEAPQTRQLVLQVNLIPDSLEDQSDPLGWEQSCASGQFDSYATELGTNLVAAGLQNSVLRLGAEMNGTWEADFMGTTTQEQNLWAACFANEVTSLRQAIGEHFLIDWDVNAGKGGYPFANFYPGNSSVDIVGLDLYDVDSNTPNTSQTFSTLADEPFGLSDFEAFAAAQGKPMSFPEWGLSNSPSGDDPGYIDGMGSSVAGGDFAFETYFEGAGTTSTTLPLGASTTPLSLISYQQWFGTATMSAGSISGTVTAAVGGDLGGVCVVALLNGSDIAASAVTAVNGTYAISGLAPGNYGVYFEPGCGGGDYATQWYSGTLSGTQSSPGILVATTATSPAININALMSAGSSISGTVTATPGGGGIAGICVSAFPVGGTSSADTASPSATDGTYSIQGLLPGTYYVQFAAGTCGGNYVTQWYDATIAGASSISAATAVPVTVGSPATGVNAEMMPSTSISGTVTTVAGADMANMCVWAYPVSGGPIEKATTALDGMYVDSGLAPGSYDVEFYTSPCGGRNYVAQWYNGTQAGSALMSTALAVSATVASPPAAINAEMALIDVITPSATAPTDPVVGGATYTPGATATSGDAVEITVDASSEGCVIDAGVVSFTATGTCVIDFNDPSSGPSDAYAGAAQVQQSFTVTASSGGGGGGGGGAPPSTPSPPVVITVSPPVTPPPPVASIPTPREVTYATNATVLSPAAKDVLRALAKKLTAGGSITVVGYAHDDAGLARRRAASVANFLVHLVSVHVSIKVITTSTVDKVMVITTKE
jgi:outer membrane protein OmpA-like peptidoglycan-associated protein